MKLSRALQLTLGGEEFVPPPIQGRTISLADYTQDDFITYAQGAYDVILSPNGTEMYVGNNWNPGGLTNPIVYEYQPAGPPFDVIPPGTATATYTANWSDTYPGHSIYFKPDGLVMYVGSFDTGLLYQISLTTAWDLSTAGTPSTSVSMGIGTSNLGNVAFNPNGKQVWITRRNSNVYLLNLSTPWDLTTASSGGFITLPVSFDAHGISFVTTSGGGYYCFMGNRSGNTVLLLRLQVEADLRYISSSSTRNFGVTAYGTNANLGALRLYIGEGDEGSAQADLYQYFASISKINFSAYSYASDGTDADTAGSGILGVSWNPTGTKAFMSHDGRINQYSASTPFQASSLTSDGVFVSYGTTPQGVFFKPDGYVLYVTYGGSTLAQTPLSKPFDLTSAGSTTTKGVAANPQSVSWRPDGQRFFISHQVSDIITQYDCTEPWNIQTATASQGSASVSRGAYSFTQGGTISSEGYRYFQGLSGNGSVVQTYDLTEPYDITTASFNNTTSVSSVQSNIQGLYVTSNTSLSSTFENTLFIAGVGTGFHLTKWTR